MHKSLYKFIKKRNKCDVTIKSTITKRTISGEEVVKKKSSKETKLERERERVLTFLQWTTWKEQRMGGNEIIRNLYEN